MPFNLRDPKVKLEGNVLQALLRVFPNTTNIINCGAYLSFEVMEIPRGPLPLTIAGLPFTIGDAKGNGKGPMFPKGILGNMSIRICEELNAKDMALTCSNFRNLASSVSRVFSALLPGVLVVEVILDATRQFHVVLADNVDIDKVEQQIPGRIAKCWTHYLHDKDLYRPTSNNRKARRQINPSAHMGVVDDTPYVTLRPGVLVSSEAFTAPGSPSRVVLSTSSGVLVQNSVGDKFMTAASHGIGRNEALYQQNPSGSIRRIGKAVVEISFTDISLIRLEPGIQFVNEPLTQAGEVLPPLKKLLGEQAGGTDELQIGSEVFLNSPQTGAMSGIVLCKSWRVESDPPTHPTESRLNHIIYDWAYLGQGEASQPITIPDGSYGTAIWDEVGRVTGFFHYHIAQGPWRGYYACVSAEEVTRAGYWLV